MQIGFDISQIAHSGGVATYTKNLAKHLSKLSDLDMVFFYSSLRKPYQGSLKNVKSFFIPPPIFEILFNRLRIPIELFLGKIDVFHSSDWTQPPTKARKVTTYHDVVALKFPHWSHPTITSVNKRRLKLVEKEVDTIIVVSQATKEDLLSISKIPEKKIVVIHEGVEDIFKPQSQNAINEFKKRYNLPQDFILVIGGIGERKNLARIKEAASDFNLVVTGDTMPYITRKDLPLLYASCKLLLYASLYEGFGLPILEAQASGIPVITSNISSMPEIAGEGALYVDPYKVKDIRGKIDSLVGDEKLKISLVKKGFDNSKKFSWEKCAEKTAEVYRKLQNI